MSKAAKDYMIIGAVIVVVGSFLGWMLRSAFMDARARAKAIAARTIKQSDKMAGDMNLTVFDLHGHTYIIASGTYKADMLHAEHCQCHLWRPMKVEAVVTNIAWQTNWITQVSDEAASNIVNKLKERK